MRVIITAALLALGLAAGGASAKSHDESDNTQNKKMAACSKEAGDKKGDERKAFMKTCLSNKPMTQQEKMKACNADPKAKTLHGDERKTFMSSCLKGDAAAAAPAH